MFENLILKLDQCAAKGIPAYDCVVYKDGKEIFRRMYGFSDYENTVPINGTEKYNIYSCSKLLTVTAAMKLFEDGKFKLDDKLSDYMPEFTDMTVADGDTVRPAVTPIRLKHLFTMTAGFTYNTKTENIERAQRDTEGRCPTREVMRYLAKDPLAFEPGTHFKYSLCHDVLAAFVEVVSGERFGQFVKRTIFDPCGMKDSSFLIPMEEYDELVAQYKYDSAGGKFLNIGKKKARRFGTEYESGGGRMRFYRK